jgi:hypothetical protein
VTTNPLLELLKSPKKEESGSNFLSLINGNAHRTCVSAGNDGGDDEEEKHKNECVTNKKPVRKREANGEKEVKK